MKESPDVRHKGFPDITGRFVTDEVSVSKLGYETYYKVFPTQILDKRIFVT